MRHSTICFLIATIFAGIVVLMLFLPARTTTDGRDYGSYGSSWLKAIAWFLLTLGLFFLSTGQ